MTTAPMPPEPGGGGYRTQADAPDEYYRGGATPPSPPRPLTFFAWPRSVRVPAGAVSWPD